MLNQKFSLNNPLSLIKRLDSCELGQTVCNLGVYCTYVSNASNLKEYPVYQALTYFGSPLVVAHVLIQSEYKLALTSAMPLLLVGMV